SNRRASAAWLLLAALRRSRGLRQARAVQLRSSREGMRAGSAWILPVLVSLTAFGSLVEGQTTTTAPAPSPPPPQETKVLGTLPDLTGRWLGIGWITLTDGRAVSVPTFWSITREDGKPVMTHRFVTLPPAM